MLWHLKQMNMKESILPTLQRLHHMTTAIIPHYWTIDGDTFKNEGRIYTKISGIVPSKDNKDGNRYVIKLKDNAGSEWSSEGISAEDLCLKQGHNDINVTIGKGVFDGDKITDVVETGDAVISFEVRQ